MPDLAVDGRLDGRPDVVDHGSGVAVQGGVGRQDVDDGAVAPGGADDGQLDAVDAAGRLGCCLPRRRPARGPRRG